MTGFALIALQAALSVATSPYAEAHKRSTETGQPLVVLVGTDWCSHCRTMKTTVIPRIRQKGLLAKVAFAAVDSERQPALAGKLMQGSSIPQLVMYWQTDRGWRRSQMTGSQSVTAIEEFISRGIADVANGKPDQQASVRHDSLMASARLADRYRPIASARSPAP